MESKAVVRYDKKLAKEKQDLDSPKDSLMAMIHEAEKAVLQWDSNQPAPKCPDDYKKAMALPEDTLEQVKVKKAAIAECFEVLDDYTSLLIAGPAPPEELVEDQVEPKRKGGKKGRGSDCKS